MNFTDQILNLDSAVLKIPCSHRGFITEACITKGKQPSQLTINQIINQSVITSIIFSFYNIFLTNLHKISVILRKSS